MALVAPPVAAMEAVQESEKKRRRAGTRKRNAPYPLWFYLPAAIIYGVLFILPTFSSFYFSLTRWTLFDIEFIGLDNFVQFFEEPMLFQGLVNTFIYGVVTSAAKVVLGLLIAVLLTSSIFGRGYLRVVIFFPVLVSVIGVGFTFRALMEPNGFINQMLALVGIDGPNWLTDPSLALTSVMIVDVWRGVGLATLIFMAGIVSIPREYYEAAIVDGASGVKTFWNITVPARAPGDRDRHHPLPHRRAAFVRSHLGHDARRPRILERCDRVGDLQAIPSRLLRTVERGKRHPVRRRDRDRPAALVVAQPKGRRVVTRTRRRGLIVGIAAILVTAVVFLIPFAFILSIALKPGPEAAELDFTWPQQFAFFENLVAVFEARDWMLVTAFFNSTVITVVSVTFLVIFAAMVGWILQRRQSRLTGLINVLVLAGLIVPPAVVPTIWVLQGLGLFKTIPGLIFIEIAFGLSFCILIFRAFIATIPRELDEAALIDGAGPVRLFFQIVLPLLRSVIVTAVVVQAVFVFNDFVNPLYFLPGAQNATVQLTLYTFQGQFATQWNLLFMNILVITIPMLLLYIFFNRQIVAGLTSGAIKG